MSNSLAAAPLGTLGLVGSRGRSIPAGFVAGSGPQVTSVEDAPFHSSPSPAHPGRLDRDHRPPYPFVVPGCRDRTSLLRSQIPSSSSWMLRRRRRRCNKSRHVSAESAAWYAAVTMEVATAMMLHRAVV